MSTLLEDNKEFQKKYGFDQAPFDLEKLKFRMDLLREEYEETRTAYLNKDAEEIVDGLVDLIVIAVGTLYLAGVDVEKAWATVFASNMSKTRGVKPGREQSGGWDVIKEPGKFIPVSHIGNHGVLDEIIAARTKA